MTTKLDLQYMKGTKFDFEIQLIDESGNPISLANKIPRLILKESVNTDIVLFDILGFVSSPEMSIILFSICAEDLVNIPDILAYNVVLGTVNDNCNLEDILFGNIEFVGSTI